MNWIQGIIACAGITVVAFVLAQTIDKLYQLERRVKKLEDKK